MKQQEYAIIVAGGRGTRFGNSTPKQFLLLKGKPVLLHTLEAFYHYSEAIRIILVLPTDETETWRRLAEQFNYRRPIVVQNGGATRFQSVRNGLERIEGDGLVAVHDGVRPLVTPGLISDSFRYASLHQSAICSVPLKESLRMIGAAAGNAASAEWQQSSKAVDRSRYRLIQTPQTFNVALLRKAYRLPEDPTMTDDASVFEHAGHSVYLFDGNYDNIKITMPEDLVVAESLLERRRLSL